MKRIFFIFIFILTASIIFASCGKQNEMIPDSVSYGQERALFGANEKYNVYVAAGLRESPFVNDGEAGPLVEFCKITVRPKEVVTANELTFSFKIGEETVNGKLVKSFGNNYAADTKKLTHGDMTNITIGILGITDDVQLENKMADITIKKDKALSIAADIFKDKINESIVSGVFPRETHIKYVNDYTDTSSPYYWYVAFIGKDGSVWAALIDPMSGNIVAKR